MVRRQRSVNNYTSSLAADITDSATSATVDSATGLPSEGDFFLDINGEIVLVTHISGTTLTVARGQAGTTAVAHVTGEQMTDVICKDEFEIRLKDMAAVRALPYGRITQWDGSSLTTLAASDFTLVNTGTGTSVTDGNDGVVVFSAKDMSADEVTGAVRTFTSSSDHRIVAHIGCVAFEEGSPDILHFYSRQAAGGSLDGISLYGREKISLNERASTTGSPTDITAHGVGGRNELWVMLEIEWDTSGSDDTLRWYYSKDGVNFWNIGNQTFTSDSCEVGIWLTNQTGSLANMRAQIFSWHEEQLTF